MNVSQSPAHPSKGITLFEIVVAVTLLGAGLAMTSKVLHSTSLVHRENERRQCALQEAANALERLRAVPWSELSSDRPPKLALSPEGQRRLPHGELTLRMHDPERATDALEVRKLVVEVAWRQPGGRPDSKVRLSGWRFARETEP